MSKLLEIKNLEVHFNTRDATIYAVNNVNLHVNECETLGIVGESGSGKSVTMMSILGLVPTPPGEIKKGTAFFKGTDLLSLSPRQLRKFQGNRIGMIFQDPMTSFNPVLSIGRQMIEALEWHKHVGRAEAYERAAHMLDLVGIPNASQRIREFPHQFSGGMRQRAMIAMALICEPELLIADEPTTALDVTIQAQIVELVLELQEKLKMSVVWITHDLAVVARLAERVSVMYGGKVIEQADVLDLYEHPNHPYTQGLLASLPSENRGTELKAIQGLPPILKEEPKGCTFAKRCSYAKPECFLTVPEMQDLGNNHFSCCRLGVK